jgi:dihydrofolate reductase
MSKVSVHMMASLDGHVAGPNQSVDKHHPREPLAMQGGTLFTFVTDGIESALEKARKAASDKDVRIGGGANVVNQYLAAGLVDELELHVVSMLMGGSARLFEGLRKARPRLELLRAVGTPEVTHLKYRVVKEVSR